MTQVFIQAMIECIYGWIDTQINLHTMNNCEKWCEGEKKVKKEIEMSFKKSSSEIFFIIFWSVMQWATSVMQKI